MAIYDIVLWLYMVLYYGYIWCCIMAIYGVVLWLYMVLYYGYIWYCQYVACVVGKSFFSFNLGSTNIKELQVTKQPWLAM